MEPIVRKLRSTSKPKLKRRMFAFVVAIISISAFRWLIYPFLTKALVKYMISLRPGTKVRETFLKLPFALIFKVYMFNLTNAMEVFNGAKPIVEEIGPYIYEEWKEKILLGEDESDDTMTFFSKETFIFRPDLSAPFTGEEMVTIPHPLIVGMVLLVLKDRPAMTSIVNKAIGSIFNNPATPFLTATVSQLLFDGIIVNCTVRDFAGKSVCSQLKVQAKELKMITDTVYKLSLLGSRNTTTTNKFKVSRGIKNYRTNGRVLEYKDEREMKIWNTKDCNRYSGTEGSTFPAMLAPGADVPIFTTVLCRSVFAKFESNIVYDGIPANKYVIDLGDMSKNPDEKCFCPTPRTCLKKGVMDLTRCTAPIIASLPHFYLSDKSYVEGVEGLHPDKDKHELVIVFESITGTGIATRTRLQFSLAILPVPQITVMKNLPNTIVPMFWIEEGVDVNSTHTKLIKLMYLGTSAINIVFWFVIVISIIGIGTTGFMFFTTDTQIQVECVNNIKLVKHRPIDSMVDKTHKKQNENNRRIAKHIMTGHEFDKY